MGGGGTVNMTRINLNYLATAKNVPQIKSQID